MTPRTLDEIWVDKNKRIATLEMELAEAKAALGEAERIVKVISECTVVHEGKYIQESGKVLKQIAITYFADKAKSADIARALLKG